MTGQMESNIFKTALLFEGGSMRDAYSAGAARYLLEQEVYFDHVYGVSAGSSNTVNYVSRDKERVVNSFGAFMAEPKAGNWKTFFQGKGLFNAEYLYYDASMPDGILPFDYEAFMANPAKVTIPSFDRDTGEDLYFTKADMPTIEDVLIRVRASSTIPFFMPAPVVAGRVCYDGGFATGGGLPLKKIMDDGFEHVVVIRTRKRGYRKGKPEPIQRLLFPTKPLMREAVLTRNKRYNQACDELDELERKGVAYVFYADNITLKGTERDAGLFYDNIRMGYEQMQRELPRILEFVHKYE